MEKLNKQGDNYILTEKELIELYKHIYNLGFSNGGMNESGLERNECDDNLNWFLEKQKK